MVDSDEQPPTGTPRPSARADHGSREEKGSTVENELARFQRRLRRVRGMFIFFLIGAGLLAFLTFSKAGSGLHHNQLRAAAAPDGGHILALLEANPLTATRRFRLGLPTTDGGAARWLHALSGAPERIAATSDGRIVAFFANQALRYPAPSDAAGIDAERAERLPYFRAAAPGQDAVALPDGRIAVAWLRSGRLGVSIAGDKLRGVRELDVPELKGRVLGARLLPSRKVISDDARAESLAEDVPLLMLALIDHAADSRTERNSGHLYGVRFGLSLQTKGKEDGRDSAGAASGESKEPSPRDAFSEEETQDDSVGLSPFPGKDDPRNEAEEDAASGEPEAPSSQEKEEELGEVYAPRTISIKRLDIDVKNFWAESEEGRAIVGYATSQSAPPHALRGERTSSGSLPAAWRIVEYDGKDWSRPCELPAFDQDGRIAKGELRPLLTLQAGRLRVFDFDGATGMLLSRSIAPAGLLATHAALSDETEAPEIAPTGGEVASPKREEPSAPVEQWRDEPALALGRSLASLMSMIFMAGVFVMLVGAALCGVWIGLHRDADLDSRLSTLVRERVGRDTGTFAAQVGAMRDQAVEWAGMLRRILALLVDLTVIALPMLLLAEVVDIDLDRALQLYPIAEPKGAEFDGIAERLVTLLMLSVYGFFCDARFGRTLGKAVFGMRVVTAEGRTPGLLALFVRNLLRPIELCHPFLILLTMLSIIFSRRRQRVADMLAGTAVAINQDDDDDDPSASEPS